MQRKVIEFALAWLETIAVIGFCLFPILGLLAGWGSGGIVGGIVGALIATVLGVAIFGGLFLMIQNNQTLKDIRALLQAKA